MSHGVMFQGTLPFSFVTKISLHSRPLAPIGFGHCTSIDADIGTLCDCDRQQIPTFDVRFRGYGLNKVQHWKVLQSRGFRFMVHHEAFIVHRPHALSKSRAVYVGGQPLSDSQGASANTASLHNITTVW